MSLQPMLGETIVVRFFTCDADGADVDADALPTCAVMEDAGDTAIVTPTVVKITGRTGAYRVTIPLVTGDGFEAGKCYEVEVAAVVAGNDASAKLLEFLLREYSVDGVNVVTINGSPATVDAVPAGTLTTGERTAIAVEMKTHVGADTTVGSLGYQSKQMYDTMAQYGGSQITGTIDATPTPTTTGFKVTLDAPLDATKVIAGIVGQVCTIRSGGAQTEANPILGCVINSLTSLSLTFGGSEVFSADPSPGDTISISE